MEKYLYSKESFIWREIPEGDWDEHLYPKGTKVEIIGEGPHGYDVKICETGVIMCETGLMKWSIKPIED